MPATRNQARIRVRLERAARGRASVATGLPVLDHLLAALAERGRFELELETAPAGAVEEEVVAVGRALGRAVRSLLAEGACGFGAAPADEALAQVTVESSGRPLLSSNVDFTWERLGGLRTDLVARLLEELVGEAGLTLHVRLLEGEDPRHVLEAIFKALGLALGQAATPSEGES